MAQDARPVNTGLSENARNAVADAIGGVLADTYALYAKTHGFHWNVTGPQFQTLHTLFEEQYNELWAALDELAERIRALGAFAPGDLGAFAERASLDRAPETPPGGEEMIGLLLADHEAVARRIRDAIEVADEADDNASEDMLVQRLQVHEKTAWMLRSMTG